MIVRTREPPSEQRLAAESERLQLLRAVDRVLLATDYSPHAEAAIEHARRFAVAFGAELHVLNVAVPPDLPWDPEKQKLAPSDAEPRELAIDLPDGKRVVHVVLRAEAPAPTILEYAEHADVGLVVMGSHGRRGLRRALLGSVTEEVLRQSHIPLLTVHRDTPIDEIRKYRTIVVPLDFSPRSPDQVAVAARLARRFDCRLELVHVVDPPVGPDLYVPLSPAITGSMALPEQVRERLEEFAAPLRPELDVAVDVLIGPAAAEIARKAETDADLIVMGSHGYSGFDRLLLGSVAEGVLRRAECGVLVLRPEQD